MAGGRGRGGDDSRCLACGRPILEQLVGMFAALQVCVTLPPATEPHPYQQAAQRATANDLVWCLPRRPFRPLHLRWTGHQHPPDCPHQHLTTHRCNTEPSTLF